MNDRYDGPYFVITVFDTGVIRVKEEARPDRPPKMVHHDRVRRFNQEEPVGVPRWVQDAIAAFQRRATMSTQTSTDVREVEATTSVQTVFTSCVRCKQHRCDDFGLIRVFDDGGCCHLCKGAVTGASLRHEGVYDDVTDHDLYHC